MVMFATHPLHEVKKRVSADSPLMNDPNTVTQTAVPFQVRLKMIRSLKRRQQVTDYNFWNIGLVGVA
jgi:hypothetical protein